MMMTMMSGIDNNADDDDVVVIVLVGWSCRLLFSSVVVAAVHMAADRQCRGRCQRRHSQRRQCYGSAAILPLPSPLPPPPPLLLLLPRPRIPTHASGGADRSPGRLPRRDRRTTRMRVCVCHTQLHRFVRTATAGDRPHRRARRPEQLRQRTASLLVVLVLVVGIHRCCCGGGLRRLPVLHVVRSAQRLVLFRRRLIRPNPALISLAPAGRRWQLWLQLQHRHRWRRPHACVAAAAWAGAAPRRFVRCHCCRHRSCRCCSADRHRHQRRAPYPIHPPPPHQRKRHHIRPFRRSQRNNRARS